MHTHGVRALLPTALAVLTAALLAACGSTQASSSSHSSAASVAKAKAKASSSSSSPAASAPALSGHAAISISGYAFSPATIVVTSGTRITFTNRDQTAHTATTTGKGFDTGTVDPGKSVTVKLSAPGRYAYVCQFHAFMHGTVIVRG